MKASKTFHKDTLRELFRELGWIIRRSNQYRGEVAWYVLLGVFGTALSLAGSLLSKYIIDAVTGFHTGPITGAGSSAVHGGAAGPADGNAERGDPDQLH